MLFNYDLGGSPALQNNMRTCCNIIFSSSGVLRITSSLPHLYHRYVVKSMNVLPLPIFVTLMRHVLAWSRSVPASVRPCKIASRKVLGSYFSFSSGNGQRCQLVNIVIIQTYISQ